MNERPHGRRRHDQAWILAGWLLFVASALFFIFSALRSGDRLALMGGIFFLVACIAFLVPVIRNWPRP